MILERLDPEFKWWLNVEFRHWIHQTSLIIILRILARNERTVIFCQKVMASCHWHSCHMTSISLIINFLCKSNQKFKFYVLISFRSIPNFKQSVSVKYTHISSQSLTRLHAYMFPTKTDFACISVPYRDNDCMYISHIKCEPHHNIYCMYICS